jgi:putative membrane protein
MYRVADAAAIHVLKVYRLMFVRLFCLAITLAAVPLSFIQAPYPDELVLQHVPTLFGVLALGYLTYPKTIHWISFSCCLAFLWLHIIGARWIYSYVPYDDWVRSLTGDTLSDYFGWQRNHYDRLVHFASGVLGVPPAAELLQRRFGMKSAGAAFMAIGMVLSVGAVYEIFEWQIAVMMSPASAEAYNGQQGDVWDPQKDMALALFGALLCAPFVSRWDVAK